MSSTPVQFCLRSEPPKAAGVPAPSIFLPMKAGDSAPPQVKVAPIPLPASRPGVSDDVPLLLRNVNPDVMAAADKDKCRIDMGTRPDAPDLAAYQRVPVHEFGYALLAGMGWSKGAPIGRSNPQVVEPFEYVRRPYLLGLGAQAIPPSLDLPSMTGKKRKKHRSAPEMVDPKTGRARYTKGIDEVLVERDRPINVGDRVRIGAGPYATLTGVVNSLGDIATVALTSTTGPFGSCCETCRAPPTL